MLMPDEANLVVRRNGEKDGWNLYVIELKRSVLKDRRFWKHNEATHIKGKPCVYVGLTCHDPEHRFNQHKESIKSARIARKFGKALMTKEGRKLRPMTRKRAQRKEAALAERLRAKCWGVWSN
jgi:hypothetical protein